MKSKAHFYSDEQNAIQGGYRSPQELYENYLIAYMVANDTNVQIPHDLPISDNDEQKAQKLAAFSFQKAKAKIKILKDNNII